MRVALNFTKYNTPALRAQFARDPGSVAESPGRAFGGRRRHLPMNEGDGFFAGVRIEAA
jgi:hypothetical protein